MRFRNKIFPACLLVCIMLMHCNLPVMAAADDFDVVTSHINIAPAKQLAILYPTKDIQTTATGFQITGTSDPNQSLTMNGAAVEGQGAGGTFAIYVALDSGANSFVFRQGDSSASITITKGNTNSASTAVTDLENLPKPLPQFDLAIKSGKTFTLKCYAPSATSATATVNGKDYALTKSGSYFTGSYTIPNVDGTVDLGTVVYTTSEPSGARTQTSGGRLFAVGKDSSLQVQVTSVSTTVFSESNLNSSFIATAKAGAVDKVVDFAGDMYKLNTGGWISAQAVRPLTSPVSLRNEVASVSFQTEESGEAFVFHGTSHPIYRANHTDTSLSITLSNTSGIGSVDVSGSKMFSTASVSEQNGHTTITFTAASAGAIWGYLVEYRDGQTILFCKYRPELSGDSSSQPLKGVTIAVDAGHGGTDPGALGVTYGHGTTEKDITLATAIALQKKLELLGANVLMLRDEDVPLDLDSRLAMAQSARVDMMISLHANSVAYSSTASSANGVEVYYYEGISKGLAQNMESRIVGATGRTSRGAKYTNFKMTLNSYAPSVLVEMGFLLNPSDFDSMCSRQGIYNTVTAISDSIINALRE